MYTNNIMHIYYDCSTQLKYKNRASPSIPVNRGVKQGYLIYRALFNSNYVTDNMIGNLQRNSTINYKAFADNLVLFSKDDVIINKVT